MNINIGTAKKQDAGAIAAARGGNKMKSINPVDAGNALAITATALYVACGLLLLVLPTPAVIAIYNGIFHGMDLSGSIGGTKSLGIILIGVAAIAVASWIGGALFAWVYNKLTRSEAA